jgi:hypothetical protein
LPLELTGNYDLSYTFTRSNGIYRIATSFPVGQRQCSLHLGAENGKTHGIGPIRGREPAESISATPAGTSTNNKLQRVDMAVRTVDDKAIVAVAYDGRKIIGWTGPREDLGSEGSPAIIVAIPGKCRVTLHAMQLTVRY